MANGKAFTPIVTGVNAGDYAILAPYEYDPATNAFAQVAPPLPAGEAMSQIGGDLTLPNG
jgi:hypothetical protein